VDAGDEKRCEYWMGELSSTRKGMTDAMKDDLARYLHETEWTRPVEERRFWKNGPAKWIREALQKGMLAVLALAILLVALIAPPASAQALADRAPDTVEHGGRRGGNNSGAGGN
jgi:hypothetical protein